jgi:hypothetical protein
MVESVLLAAAMKSSTRLHGTDIPVDIPLYNDDMSTSQTFFSETFLRVKTARTYRTTREIGPGVEKDRQTNSKWIIQSFCDKSG